MRGTKGFTLIEMMIVILVISVLATIVGLSVKNAGQKAKDATERAHLTTLQNAVDLYNNSVGVWPPALVDLTRTTGPVGYDGPYVRQIPPHPWLGTYILNPATGEVTSLHP